MLVEQREEKARRGDESVVQEDSREVVEGDIGDGVASEVAYLPVEQWKQLLHGNQQGRSSVGEQDSQKDNEETRGQPDVGSEGGDGLVPYLVPISFQQSMDGGSLGYGDEENPDEACFRREKHEADGDSGRGSENGVQEEPHIGRNVLRIDAKPEHGNLGDGCWLR